MVMVPVKCKTMYTDVITKGIPQPHRKCRSSDLDLLGNGTEFLIDNLISIEIMLIHKHVARDPWVKVIDAAVQA